MTNDGIDRIRKRYQERDSRDGVTNFWTLRNPIVAHIAQQKERVMLRLLERLHINLGQCTILDVGCGMGGELVNYLRWGAHKNNIIGIDLMYHRLLAARNHLDFMVINGTGDQLPFPDEHFDIVFQNVVFTSIVESDLKQKIADEMNRTLKPGGFVVWYDAIRSRSRDPHYRPVSREEITRLFPQIEFEFTPLTTDLGILKLAYKLLGGIGLSLIDIMQPFQTHTIAIGRKTAS